VPTYHDDPPGRMRGDLRADRSKQQPGELATPARADDDHVRRRPVLAQRGAGRTGVQDLPNPRDELDLTAVPPQDRARLQRLLEAVSAELERSVSPALADGLHEPVRLGEAVPGAAELRTEYRASSAGPAA
jgi:hypothetical protein